MANLDSRKVESALLKKGFKVDAAKKDHKYYRFFYQGKETEIFTKTSHNGQDIGSSLIKAMSQQLDMDKAFFKSFVSCTKTQSDYQKILQEKGRLK